MYKKITAIVRESQFEGISAQLTAMGIGGLSVSRVKGYGEYQNEFSADGMIEHFKLEIWLEDKIAQSVVRAIMDQAHTGLEGDGIIAVENVPELYRIRTRSKIN